MDGRAVRVVFGRHGRQAPAASHAPLQLMNEWKARSPGQSSFLPDDVERPARLGPYEIQEQIGEGGMAKVYRAYQPVVDRDVAIKVIRQSLDQDLEAITRFQREARLIARLEHPFILPVYDFYSGHGPPYIVMRLVEGMTLGDRLQHGLPAVDEALHLIGQIGSGLDYAHRHGIVHRDIKPSNILIDGDGNAFLTDFGIAYMLSDADLTSTMRGSGAFIGTPSYMAPEQIRAEEITQAVDIYALGAVIFEMLTGQLPFSSDNPAMVLALHLQAPVPMASERNPALLPEIDAVLARALAKEPEDRYPTVSSLIEAVFVALTGSQSPARSRAGVAHYQGSPTRHDYTPEADRTMVQRPGELKRYVTALYIAAAEFVTALDDLKGSEAARRGIDELWQLAGFVISSGGGTIFTRTSDTILALWGAEQSREDDAERAIQAALALGEGFRQHCHAYLGERAGDGSQLLSMGLNTGIVLLSHDERQAGFGLSGATISLASRLAHQGQGGIIIAHETYSQVRGVFNVQPFGRIERGGLRQAIQTYQVMAAKPRAFRIRTQGIEGLETMMVGRQAELALLTDAFQRMFADRKAQLFTIVGRAGIGKSRLLYEFANWCELRPEFYWLMQGRATAEMTARPYALLRDLISFRFEILDSDSPEAVIRKLEQGIEAQIGADQEMAHLLGYLAGFELPASPHIDAWRAEPRELIGRAKSLFSRWLAELSTIDPVLIQLDDIHLADEPSLALLSALIDVQPDLPILVVGLARPTLYDRQPDWGSHLPNHHKLALRPLDKEASRALVREILQKAETVPARLTELLVDQAEGNPFYMEELVKMLIEDRVILKVDDKHWRVEADRLDRLPVPTTLAGLLQARLDSLLLPEKLTLQRAAVIGRIFSEEALIALDRTDDFKVGDPGPILESLVKREYIYRRETATPAGSAEYVFRSKMMQDVLLETLPRGVKSTYYEAAGRWLVEASADRAPEQGAVIARYFDQAGRTPEAANWYTQAAEHAFRHGALTGSREAFDRALALIPEEDSLRRWRALVGRNEVLGHLGETEARSADDEALLALARELGDDDRLAEAYLRQGYSAMLHGDYPTSLAALEQAGEHVRLSGNLAIEARRLGLKVTAQVRLGYLQAAGVTAEEALTKAEALGNEEILARTLNNVTFYYTAVGDLAQSATMCQRQVALCEQIGHRIGQAQALLNLGYFYVLMGLYEQGREALEQSLALAHAAGSRPTAAYNQLNLALVHINLSNCQQALELLGQACSFLETAGDAFGLAAGHFYHGLALEACSDFVPAREQFARAAEEFGSGEMAANLIDARAGIARCAQAVGATEESLSEAAYVWDRLAAEGGPVPEFPILAYLTCAQIFAANGREQAARQALETGYADLMERAERISDTKWRASFLNEVPAHQAISEMWKGTFPDHP